jgi:helix-turn-helix, Psq domain
MLFLELFSTSYEVMADSFANLTKAERIEKAVEACAKDRTLSARRASKIYQVAHTTITRRLAQAVMPEKVFHRSQQLLTPIEERTVVKWAIQYYK